jgi:hypothetical protein
MMAKKPLIVDKKPPLLTYRQKIERDIIDHGRGGRRFCCLEKPWEAHCARHVWHD